VQSSGGTRRAPWRGSGPALRPIQPSLAVAPGQVFRRFE